MFNNTFTIISIIVAVIISIALILAWPFITIWALNNLFGLSIAFTLKTWLAMLVLQLGLFTRVSVNRS